MAGHSGLCRCMCKLVAVLAVLASGCGRGESPVVAGGPVGTRGGADWPRFLGPAGTGVSPETGIRTDWSGGLRVLWQLPIGEGYCAPVVAGDRLFHFDRHGAQARVRAYGTESATEIWRFEYPTDYRDKYGYDGGPRACPVVDGDRVYIYGPEGMLYCLAT